MFLKSLFVVLRQYICFIAWLLQPSAEYIITGESYQDWKKCMLVPQGEYARCISLWVLLFNRVV
jgi:hypothetical protein